VAKPASAANAGTGDTATLGRMGTTVDVRPAADRAVTTNSWLTSRHSFSFGDHYDPVNTHHGLLLVNNDDIVAADTGFDMHPHRDMEIVTWVLSGSLAHADSAGNSGVIRPGLAQRMSAGTGIRHSEKNESSVEPVRFIQMWLVPDEPGIAPEYQQQEVDIDGGLMTIASGRADDAAVAVHNRHAALHGARLQDGQSVELPEAPYVHLFVARGRLALEDVGTIGEGDAVRFAGSGGQRLTASELSEILVWEMHAGLAA
jgi:redox-sensitive bicupin YhaK (pirin superfamily)